MSEKVEFNIEECFWQDVQEKFKIQPKLFNIINDLSPDKSYTILKASYPFGATIFDSGIFYLPTKNKHVIPIADRRVPAHIQAQFDYNKFPLGFSIGNGAVEVYKELKDRVFSLGYFENGLDLGIWESLAPATPYKVVAGARSLHMLPRLTDREGQKNLTKKFGIKSPMPLHAFEQWAVFKEIANSKAFEQPWSCDVLFFSKKWMEKIKNDKAWSPFYVFLLLSAWRHTEYVRSKIMLDTMWQSFSNVLKNSRIKPNSNSIETLKHLISVAMGTLPAFAPAINNLAAPIDGLLKAYLEVYALKNYTPSMMQPHYFSLNHPQDFCYYSLQLTSFLESIPCSRSPHSARVELEELITLLDRFMIELINHNLLNDEIKHVYKTLSKIQFDGFHSEEDKNKGIYSSNEMAIEDPNLLYLPKGYNQNRKFCERSTFVRGCIRISSK